MAPHFPTSGLSDALVILGAAGIVIPAFARFKVSPVIGFILVGLLVGPHGLGAMVGAQPWLGYITISNPEAIEPFAQFGIVLLLFSIGLELSFRRLWGMRKLVFGVGAAELLGSAAIIALGLHLIGQSWGGAIGLGLALALSSTAVVLPLVGTTSPVGRSAFAMLLFEDLALVPIIFVLGVLGPFGATGGWAGAVDVLWMGGLTIAAMLVAGRIFLPRLFAQAARAKSPEMFLSAALLVAIVASLITTAVGLSPFAGALLAGILIAETEYHGEVEVVTAPFRGLGLGIFLITVGMSLDMAVVLRHWQSLLLALIGVVVVKGIVTGFLLRLAGARKAVAAEAGVLMGSPAETTLVVLATASAAGLIQPSTAAFWQIVTALGLTVTPALAALGRATARRIDFHADPDVPEVTPGADVAVESDVDAVAAARKEGYPVIFGDISRQELIEKLNLAHASALILTMDDPVLTVRIVKKVREALPDLTIVARARDSAHAAELYQAGATDAVPETLEASLQLSEAVLVDLGMAMGPVIASIHEKRAELRQQIMEMGRLDKEPPIRRHRLGGED
jgi:monovalent cation:H+ antiporter-2, CPA2 family